MNKIELKVDYDEFCNWYFDDITSDSIITDLITDGVVSIKCIADSVGYLPLSLIQNQDDIDKDDIEDEEIVELNNRYKINLLRK